MTDVMADDAQGSIFLNIQLANKCYSYSLTQHLTYLKRLILLTLESNSIIKTTIDNNIHLTKEKQPMLP